MSNKLFTQWAYSENELNWICILGTKFASKLEQIVPIEHQAEALESVNARGSFEWTIDNSKARLKIEIVN